MEWKEINSEGSELHTASSSRESSCDYSDDESNWFPPELQEILTEHGGILRDDIPVLSLDDPNVNTGVIKGDLKISRHVGVSAIYENEKRVIFICFTTRDKIYYFDAKNEKQVSFVARQLYRKSSGVQFYFANGAIISHLMDHLGIELRNENRLLGNHHFSDQVNRTDLVSLDLYLSVKENLSRQTLNNKYSLSFILNTVKPRQLGYEELLVKYFPGIRVDRLNLGYSREDLAQIGSSPDSQLAKNIIKKRAAPLRSLALAMLQEYKRQKETPSQQIFAFAKMKDDAKELFDRSCVTDKGIIEYRHLCGFIKKYPIDELNFL